MPDYKKSSLDEVVIPQQLKEFILNAEVFECSGESGTKTFFINKDKGFYLKIENSLKLKGEYENGLFLFSKGFFPKILFYITENNCDFLLTERLNGHTGIEKNQNTSDMTTCEIFATGIKYLHEININECKNSKASFYFKYSNKDKCTNLLEKVHLNYKNRIFDKKLAEFIFSFNIANIKNIFSNVDIHLFYDFILNNCHLLKDEVFIHGDYCLPNIVVDEGKFQGFLDVGDFGIGDRHQDLFWATYSIMRNFNNNECLSVFYKTYGYDLIDKTKLLLCSLIYIFAV